MRLRSPKGKQQPNLKGCNGEEEEEEDDDDDDDDV